ncbi:MAG: isoprenylcysteine carboxylmethyltransferase family protein [Alphaproteobacteria bacterium]|nr:isoprenylcysteine carboxylmethyltransferase family protein [Alphaproteobacteria bacterium]
MQTAFATAHDGSKLNNRAPAGVDSSSWISWACYSVGFVLAASPSAAQDMRGGGLGVAVLLTSVAAFFIATLLIQRHMRLSLAASSFGHPAQLVTDGVFRYSCNPIYVAFLLPLLSLGYYSPVAAFVASLTYIAAMTVFVIKPEERVLGEEFGAEYQAYKAQTPRWFGLL